MGVFYIIKWLWVNVQIAKIGVGVRAVELCDGVPIKKAPQGGRVGQNNDVSHWFSFVGSYRYLTTS